MGELNREAIEKYFEQKLRRSGHTLEIMVTKVLSQYSLQQEVPYIDKDESKGRFTDIIATRQIPSSQDFGKRNNDDKRVVGQFVLVIECKNLPDHGWIFWESKPPGLVFVDNASLADNTPPDLLKNDPAYKYLPWQTIPDLFSASGYEEYIYDSGEKGIQTKSNSRTTNILDAIMKVTKATEYHVEMMRDILSKTMVTAASEIDNLLLFSFVQPCIVFEGHMYGARDEEEIKLREIKFAQLPKRYVSEHYDISKGMVHIVSYDSLPEYLSLIDSTYLSSANEMLKEQEQLLDKVFIMHDYLSKRVNFHLGSCSGKFQNLLEYIQGGQLESKLSDIRAPFIYLHKKDSDKVTDSYASNLYSREFNYCFNCGTEVTTMSKPKELACCPTFKKMLSNNSIELVIDETGFDMHRFYLNAINRRDFLQFINKNLNTDVDEVIIKWCPYCGVRIPDISK